MPGWSNKLGTTFYYAGTRCVTSSRVDTVPGILFTVNLSFDSAHTHMCWTNASYLSFDTLIVRILICVGQMLGVSIQGLVFCGLKLPLISYAVPLMFDDMVSSS